MKQKSPRAGGAKASVTDRADQDGSFNPKIKRPQLRYVAVRGPDRLECFTVVAVYKRGRVQIGYSASFSGAFEVARNKATDKGLLVAITNEVREAKKFTLYPDGTGGIIEF